VSGTDSDAVPETSSPSITVTVANPPPSVEIDLPQPGTIVSGTVTMSGWALDNTTTVGPGVASVIVKVDGTQVGTATYGTLRGDVCVVYPGRVGCPNVGYVYALDTSKLTAGPHTLTVVATSAVNSADTGTYSVTVTK
jgi:N-acetylmuramoyl-L-alanine amidase